MKQKSPTKTIKRVHQHDSDEFSLMTFLIYKSQVYMCDIMGT